MAIAKIHEFSTGITPQKLADGGWVSRGFTGQYMNSTLDEIPHPIERSIANKEFAVAEGASSDRPTVIGRAIESWYVVAFVTKGRDEKGRGASFYRYFLTEAQDGLSLILNFLRKRNEKGQQVTFNPYAQVVEPYKVSTTVSASSAKVNSQVQELPELLDPNRSYTPEQVNERAIAYSHSYGKPTAWAFNVEALEQPNRFQVILPTNEAAARRIRQSLSTAPSTNATHSIDEQAVKTAIKNLINTSQPKPESFQTLASSMNNIQEELDNVEAQQFWNALFSSQGADNAVKQKIYSQSMAKLLTIRAIVLPHTLSSFWDWLGQIPDRKQQQELVSSSLSLQSQGDTVANSFSSLQQSLLSGVDIITTAVFSKQLSPEGAYRLLCRESIWGKVFPIHLQNVKHDAGNFLPPVHQKNRVSQAEQPYTTTEWQRIIKGLRGDRSQKDNKDSRYIALGEMFTALDEPVLAACCYQAGAGLVPSETYQAARSRNEFNQGRPFGGSLLVRQKTTAESIFTFLSHPLILGALGISLIGLMLWLLGPKLFKAVSPIWQAGSDSPEVAQPEVETERDIINPTKVNEKPLGESDLIEGTELPEAELPTEREQRFPSVTYFAIEGLVDTILADTENPDGQVSLEETELAAIQQVISTLLGGRSVSEHELGALDYLAMLPSSDVPSEMEPIVRNRWRALIYSYQKNKGLVADGDLTNPGETYKALIEDLTIQPSTEPPPNSRS